MSYWDRADAFHKHRDIGVKVIVAPYPKWHFFIRQQDGWNSHYQRAVSRISAQPDVADYLKRRAALDYVATEADRETSERMVRDAFIEGCLASWKVTGRNGRPLPLTNANAVSLLEAFPDIYAELQKAAVDPDRFKLPDGDDTDAKAEIAAGN